MGTKQHHHRKFPRTIARFLQLEGGQYGTLDLVALTEETLELQLGADFVQFTREQAEDLRDAVQTFLDVECAEEPKRGDRVEERVEERVEVVENELPSEPPVPTRRKRARATSE
jgi:hypothetical protein